MLQIFISGNQRNYDRILLLPLETSLVSFLKEDNQMG